MITFSTWNIKTVDLRTIYIVHNDPSAAHVHPRDRILVSLHIKQMRKLSVYLVHVAFGRTKYEKLVNSRVGIHTLMTPFHITT